MAEPFTVEVIVHWAKKDFDRFDANDEVDDPVVAVVCASILLEELADCADGLGSMTYNSTGRDVHDSRVGILE
jgi:hypothetical protein